MYYDNSIRRGRKFVAILALVALLMTNPGLAFSATEVVILNETFSTVPNGSIPTGWTETESGRFGVFGDGNAATALFADYNNIPYANAVSADVVLPTLNLAGATEAVLTFTALCDTEYTSPESGDYLALRFSNGGSATEIARWNEQSLDSDTNAEGIASKELSFAIPQEFLTQSLGISFSWNSNASGNSAEGCSLDNVKIMANGGVPFSTGGSGGDPTDTVAPQVSLSPANGSTTPRTATNGVMIVATTNENVLNCVATITTPETTRLMQNDGSGTRFTETIDLPVGTYALSVECTDAAGNIGTSSSSFTLTPEDTGTGGSDTPIAITGCGAVLSEAGRTYVLQNDMGSTDTCIVITGDNIILDGNGKTIHGGEIRPNRYGVYVDQASGVTVENVHVTAYEAGIMGATTTATTLSNVTLSNNTFGILWRNGANLNFRNISANNNADSGIYLDTVTGSSVATTTTSNSNNEVGLYLLHSSGNTISNVTANENDRGILLIGSTNNTLSSIATARNEFGLAFEIGSSGNTLQGLTSTDDGTAISVGSPNNTLNALSISGARLRAIRLFDENAESTQLRDVSIQNSGASATDLVLEATTMDGTLLHNVSAGSYKITTPTLFTVSNNHGAVTFLDHATSTGTHITDAISITPFAISTSGFDRNARFTMHHVTQNQTNYTLLRNGTVCTVCTVEGTLGSPNTVWTATAGGTFTLTWDTVPNEPPSGGNGTTTPSLSNIRIINPVSGDAIATTTTGVGSIVRFDSAHISLFDLYLTTPEGILVATLATSTSANGGKYNWVPSFSLNSGTYTIEVRASNDASLKATTAPFALIHNPSIVTILNTPINPSSFPQGVFPTTPPLATTTMTVLQFFGTIQNPYILSSSPNLLLYLPENASGIPLGLSDFTVGTTNGNGAILGNLFMSATTSSGIIGAYFQAGTDVVAEFTDSWDGTLHTPKVVSASGISTTLSDVLVASIGKAISIGSDTARLYFSKAVRLFIDGGANTNIGYVADGKIVPISTLCSADSTVAGNALPPRGDCRMTIGDDLVVWTKHLTTFVTYTTATTTPPTTQPTSQPSSSSGGGGGGGGGNGPIMNLVFSPAGTVISPSLGDMNKDGILDSRDIDAFIALIGTDREREADLTGDGFVDLRDFNKLMTLF